MSCDAPTPAPRARRSAREAFEDPSANARSSNSDSDDDYEAVTSKRPRPSARRARLARAVTVATRDAVSIDATDGPSAVPNSAAVDGAHGESSNGGAATVLTATSDGPLPCDGADVDDHALMEALTNGDVTIAYDCMPGGFSSAALNSMSECTGLLYRHVPADATPCGPAAVVAYHDFVFDAGFDVTALLGVNPFTFAGVHSSEAHDTEGPMQLAPLAVPATVEQVGGAAAPPHGQRRHVYTAEEKKARRREQNRLAQQRFRDKRNHAAPM